MKNVVHVIPAPSIFGPIVQKFADDLGQACFFYGIEKNIWRNVKDFFALYFMCKKNPDALFVFHRVPHYRIGVLSFFLRNFHYCLLYWGDDYYSTFLDEIRFEQHCIRKSPLLNKKYYRARRSVFYPTFILQLRRYVGLRVVAGAEAVLSLTPKHFRLLRSFYLKIFGVRLKTPRILVRRYLPDIDVGSIKQFGMTEIDEITVVICHSATASVAHEQSLEILKKYKEKWRVKVNVRGFLSYSGGDERYRDALEARLKERADFADSACFDRKFLSTAEVQRNLKDVDIAVFSCLRDEGVGLLTQFARMGGMLSFNKYSFNYDFFKDVFPNKLLSHEQFLDFSPQQLYDERRQPVATPPPMLAYSELGNIRIRNRE